MDHISYNAVGKFNYWSTLIDADNAYYVQFFRTDGSGTTDWGDSTDVLPLPSGENNMFEITSESPVWWADSYKYVEVKETVYDTTNDPVWEDYGIYTIYLEAPSWWTIKGEVTTCYKFGSENETWPGLAMEEVSKTDTTTLYKTEFDTSKYNTCIFAVNNGAYQTANLDIPFEEFGSDATILATLPSTEVENKLATVTWSTYSA